MNRDRHVVGALQFRLRVSVTTIASILCLAGSAWSAETFTAKCIGVIDGDTIDVLRGTEPLRLRIYGIDAPDRGQPFFDRAKQHMSELVFGKNVVVFVGDSSTYERPIASVRVGDIDVSEAMVKAGLAWHYERYTNDPALAALQQRARAAGIGLWSATRPQPPWVHRDEKRARSRADVSSVGPYHGNVRSGVFHQSSCPHFYCKNCSRIFADRVGAIDAGFRPCGQCQP